MVWGPSGNLAAIALSFVQYYTHTLKLLASEAFIEILILLAHLSVVQSYVAGREEFQIVELFAGAARVSRLAKALGIRASALDKALCKGNNRDVTNCMDINTDAGFLLLVNI